MKSEKLSEGGSVRGLISPTSRMGDVENFASFSGLVELSQEKLGARAIACSDEFFAEKENLLKPGRGVFIEGKYTDHGKWMDGWESRRSRKTEHDWCIIKLGVAGEVTALDIDTNHFLGNHPQFASAEAVFIDGNPDEEELTNCEWSQILPQMTLLPGSQNLFSVRNRMKASHIRLKIYPDGGVARFRVYGHVVTNWQSGDEIDLAALENGGKAIACSDMFFSSMNNLIMPERGHDMSDGWETRRSRNPGHHDWVILRLAGQGRIKKIIVDTNHFKGNYPESCLLQGARVSSHDLSSLLYDESIWFDILPLVKLSAHQEHTYSVEITDHEMVSHVRLKIFPDGGISRLRLFGELLL